MQPPPPPISSWVLPGQALLGWDRRMQKVGDQGGRVTGVLFFMFPQRTRGHIRPCPCVQRPSQWYRGVDPHACAQVHCHLCAGVSPNGGGKAF